MIRHNNINAIIIPPLDGQKRIFEEISMWVRTRILLLLMRDNLKANLCAVYERKSAGF